MNDYPSEEELKTIKEFDLTKKPVGELLDYIEPLWKYPDRFVRTKHALYLSTGGWSGNESIIEAMQENHHFWSMYWFKTRRGGHYWFNDKLVRTPTGFPLASEIRRLSNFTGRMK